MVSITIHPTAEVSPLAIIGSATKIWNYTQIREGARIGAECIVGRDVYIDADVQIGNRVKIQNSALLYRGVTVADGVFIGPRVCFTNDRYPRAITPEGALKNALDWEQGETTVGYGASIGAGAIIVTGITIGEFAMVAAGAVVTRDVPPHGLVMGVPARLVGHVCACGKPIGGLDEYQSPIHQDERHHASSNDRTSPQTGHIGHIQTDSPHQNDGNRSDNLSSRDELYCSACLDERKVVYHNG